MHAALSPAVQADIAQFIAGINRLVHNCCCALQHNETGKEQGGGGVLEDGHQPNGFNLTHIRASNRNTMGLSCRLSQCMDLIYVIVEIMA